MHGKSIIGCFCLIGSIFRVVSRINSGKFAVPWEDTEAILKDSGVHMTIYTPTDTA